MININVVFALINKSFNIDSKKIIPKKYCILASLSSSLMYHLDIFFDRGSNISKEIPFFGVFSTKGQGRTEEQL